jgi:hypothetical protein
MESLALEEAVGVNSETDQARPTKDSSLLALRIPLPFSDDAKSG